MAKKYPKLSIKLLIVFVCGLAIPLSLYTKEFRRQKAQEQAIEEITKLGGGVGWNYREGRIEVARRPVIAIALSGRKISDVTLKLMRPYLELLPEIETLDLTAVKITYEGLASLKVLPGLKCLTFRESHDVTDSGFEQLVHLTKLEILNLDDTKITVEGLLRLKGLSHLRGIELNETNISDGDLERIALELERDHFWPRLEWMNLCQTPVTEKGLRRIRKALPGCSISN